MPRPPLPPYPERYLQAWRFDDPAWLIPGGWGTLAALNLQQRESWSGYALDLSGPGPALFVLPAKALDGQPNLTLDSGTLRFYFAPDWSSAGLGGGPGGETRLLEFGAWADRGQQSLAWLGVDGTGTTMRLVVHGAGGPVEILRAPLQWAAGQWHQVALVWSGKESVVLYLDGQAAAVGIGLDLSALNQLNGMAGFCVGSDAEGNRLAQGQFEELYTFSRACPAEEVAWNYEVEAKRTTLGPITEKEEQARLEAIAEALLVAAKSDASNRGNTQAAMGALNYGTALWLEIGAYSSTEIQRILHNAEAGKQYDILSTADLTCQCWVYEKSVTGATPPDTTQTMVAKNGRNTLFFSARKAAYVAQPSFPGLRFEDTFSEVPDTMGAVGPNHFVELLIGTIVVYDKSGQRVGEPLSSKEFFRTGQFPSGVRVVDPRIVYDHLRSRWVACGLDITGGASSGDVGLAVSHTDQPIPLAGLESNWAKYQLPFAITERKDTADFPTLGVDANGIYISVLYPGGKSNKVVVVDKQGIYAQPPVLTFWSFDVPAAPHMRVIQAPVSFEQAPVGNLVWLITKGSAQISGDYQGGAILYRRLQWINGVPSPVDGDWLEVQESFAYRDYFDLDDTATGAPQDGGSTQIKLGAVDGGGPVGSKLSMAVIRDGTLWTCHHVGLDGADGDYDGDHTGSSVDRSGVQCLRLHISETGHLVMMSSDDVGRIWDKCGSQPRWYYYPSLMVNSHHDVVVGFSGSSELSFVSAYYSGRRAGCTAMESPVLIKAGEEYYDLERWGDYSYTSLDPSDGLTIWTVQEYARPPLPPPPVPRPAWGTWIARIMRQD